MADYIVTSGELTTVANAIRAKNGTSSNLSWPDGFVSGISSGSGGGGSSDFSIANVTVVNGGTSPNATEIEFIGINPNNDELGMIFISNGGVYECVLYKNKCLINTNTDTFVSCAGNASYEIDDIDVYITITGDCTITLKFPSL